MKTKIAMLVFAVVAIALAVVLFVSRQKAAEQQQQDTVTILHHSNKWVTVQESFERELQVTAMLQRDLGKLKSEQNELTNVLTRTRDKLTATEGSLATTTASLQAAQETISQRDARIAALESQNNELDRRAADLTTAITNLSSQIADTQRRLATSEGDKAFLEKELQRLMAEKAGLERQFNDLVVLRAQVAKLKEELNLSRRIEWIRKGLFSPGEQKGAALLLQGANAPGRPAPPAARYDLNVEVGSDGSVRVIPPLTNAPAATNPPAQ